MKDKELATQLRAALRNLQEISSNQNYYDAHAGTSYSINVTLAQLNKDHPEFTIYEQAFINVVDGATGHAGVEVYVTAMRDPNCDYMKLENGSTLRDCEIVFDEAYKLGLNRALEAA